MKRKQKWPQTVSWHETPDVLPFPSLYLRTAFLFVSFFEMRMTLSLYVLNSRICQRLPNEFQTKRWTYENIKTWDIISTNKFSIERAWNCFYSITRKNNTVGREGNVLMFYLQMLLNVISILYSHVLWCLFVFWPSSACIHFDFFSFCQTDVGRRLSTESSRILWVHQKLSFQWICWSWWFNLDWRLWCLFVCGMYDFHSLLLPFREFQLINLSGNL